MQILEHQCLYLNNLISFKATIEKNNLQNLINYVYSNICKLHVYMKDNIVFTASSDDNNLNVEVLVPVTGEMKSCENFSIKPVYKLTNAVVIRHEGLFSKLNETIECLKKYIEKKAYQSITSPYCRIIRNDTGNDMIVDIYIGLNSNIL